MSYFLEGRYFATLKFRQHEECLELLINKRLPNLIVQSKHDATRTIASSTRSVKRGEPVSRTEAANPRCAPTY